MLKISSGSPLYWKKKNKKVHLYEEEETLSKKQFVTPPDPDTVHLSESFTLQTQVGTIFGDTRLTFGSLLLSETTDFLYISINMYHPGHVLLKTISIGKETRI